MDIITEYEALILHRKNLISNVQTLEKEISEKEQEKLLVERYKIVLQSVRSYLVLMMKDRMETIQKLALKDIITGTEYDFMMTITDRYNKSNLDIMISKEENGVKRYRSLENSGDGIKSLLRISSLISALVFSENRNFLWLDEEATGISKEHGVENYFEQTMQWLQRVCDKFGFQIILITHEKDVVKYAKKSYYIKKGICGEP